ncbi:MAG: methylenetetrahydrofolate reductase [NAD(P)H] [Bacillota bacterium]|nr:methylenetetrahydrofolate reductase [NAD(P)H] [Bacillota bacterium]
MRINELYKQKKTVVSLEIFPPKKDSGVTTLYDTLREIKNLAPDFISVTYSAGGSGNSEKTVQIASDIKKVYGIESMAHLTCIKAEEDDIDRFAESLLQNGVDNIMSLRGDIPAGNTDPLGQFRFAKDLISYIKEKYPTFCIGAAAYPEGHIACDNLDLSLDHLKEKVDAGAEFLVTQLFFDNDYFYNFYDKALKKGINIPVSAGVMPILSRSQIEKMIFMCGVSLPSGIVRLLNKYESDPVSLKKAGIDHAVNQLLDLCEHGVPGVHIYTMNQPDIAKECMQKVREVI